MNIIVPDSWFREFLKTSAKPSQISEALSLCAASVEKVEKLKNDFLYHLEVTTNRVDMASIFGLAREAAAVLPRFGFKAELKNLPEPPSTFKLKPSVDYLTVKISDPTVCPRFTAILLKNVTIKPSPPLIRERLEMCGIRALNNVVDISNYVMLELGQPMHTFDFDKISGHKMLLRVSQKGESIVTLDEVKRKLPEGSIIIEDGEGRIIDLCGIMGGENSAINSQTRRVLLFVQTYNPVKIRQTCQKMAFRTEAASLFEKSLDPENVPLALERAVKLLKETTQGEAIKEAIDLYPTPYQPTTLKLEFSRVEKHLGVEIPEKEIIKILESLGFQCQTALSHLLVSVPSFRTQDVSLPEDLIEEVARIYGYYHLPSSLPGGTTGQTPQDKSFGWEERAKTALKYWGLTETYTYSMVSEKNLQDCGFKPKETLKILNPLTEELTYLRPSLIVSLLLVYQKNQYLKEALGFFELSNIYLPQKGKLPEEKARLCAILTGEKFPEAKGIIESLLEDLGIKNLQFLPYAKHSSPEANLWHPGKTAVIKRGAGEELGYLGQIHPQVLAKFDILESATVFDLDFDQILKLATTQKGYHSIPKYPPIIEDLAIVAPPQVLTAILIETVKNTSNLITEVSLLDHFKDTRTFRIIYQHPKRNLKNEEVTGIRSKILQVLKKKFDASLKE